MKRVTQKRGRKITVGNDTINITITVVECRGNQVSLGIDAPSDLKITWEGEPEKRGDSARQMENASAQ